MRGVIHIDPLPIGDRIPIRANAQPRRGVAMGLVQMVRRCRVIFERDERVIEIQQQRDLRRLILRNQGLVQGQCRLRLFLGQIGIRGCPAHKGRGCCRLRQCLECLDGLWHPLEFVQ